MKKVEIYTTPTCVYCLQAKDYFKENNLDYVEYNVATDLEKRKDMIEKSGQMGVPVISVGETVVVGFDKTKISSLLGLV